MNVQVNLALTATSPVLINLALTATSHWTLYCNLLLNIEMSTNRHGGVTGSGVGSLVGPGVGPTIATNSHTSLTYHEVKSHTLLSTSLTRRVGDSRVHCLLPNEQAFYEKKDSTDPFVFNVAQLCAHGSKLAISFWRWLKSIKIGCSTCLEWGK